MAFKSKRKVQLQEVIDLLVAGSPIPSSTGSQLDQLRDEVTGIHYYDTDSEQKLFDSAQPIRCLDKLRQAERLPGSKLLKQLSDRTHTPIGFLLCKLASVYYTWSNNSTELNVIKGEMRGLAEVYQLTGKPLPRITQPTLAHAFKAGEAKLALRYSADLIGETLCILSEWVETYNKTIQNKERPVKHPSKLQTKYKVPTRTLNRWKTLYEKMKEEGDIG